MRPGLVHCCSRFLLCHNHTYNIDVFSLELILNSKCICFAVLSEQEAVVSSSIFKILPGVEFEGVSVEIVAQFKTFYLRHACFTQIEFFNVSRNVAFP